MITIKGGLNGSNEKRKEVVIEEIVGAEVVEPEVVEQEVEWPPQQFLAQFQFTEFQLAFQTFFLEEEVELAAQIRAKGATGGADGDASPEEGRAQESEAGDRDRALEGAPCRS